MLRYTTIACFAALLSAGCSNEPAKIGDAPSPEVAAKQQADQPSLRASLKLPKGAAGGSLSMCVVVSVDKQAAMLERHVAKGHIRNDGELAPVVDGAVKIDGKQLLAKLEDAAGNLEAETFTDCLALGLDERLPTTVFVQLGEMLGTAKWPRVVLLTEGAKEGPTIGLGKPRGSLGEIDPNGEPLRVVMGANGITELNGQTGEPAALQKQVERITEMREGVLTYVKFAPGTTFGQVFPHLTSEPEKIWWMPVNELPPGDPPAEEPSLFDDAILQTPVKFDGPKTQVVVTVCAGADGKVAEVKVPKGVGTELAETIKKTLKSWRFKPASSKRCGDTTLDLGK